MATEKQIKANRKNGKLWGPKTSSGKMVVRRNALKHGITAKIFFNSEDQKEYDRILFALVQEYSPVWFTEIVLLERMAVSLFKTQRTMRMQDQYFQQSSTKNIESRRYIPTADDLTE